MAAIDQRAERYAHTRLDQPFSTRYDAAVFDRRTDGLYAACNAIRSAGERINDRIVTASRTDRVLRAGQPRFPKFPRNYDGQADG